VDVVGGVDAAGGGAGVVGGEDAADGVDVGGGVDIVGAVGLGCWAASVRTLASDTNTTDRIERTDCVNPQTGRINTR
jgi:hypothetical protein